MSSKNDFDTRKSEENNLFFLIKDREKLFNLATNKIELCHVNYFAEFHSLKPGFNFAASF